MGVISDDVEGSVAFLYNKLRAAMLKEAPIDGQKYARQNGGWSVVTGGGGGSGTITSVKMNGVVVATEGEADLGTVITQHQSLAAYALKSEIPTIPTNISAFTNDVGYLTQHQSLASYATIAYVDSIVGDVESALAALR